MDIRHLVGTGLLALALTTPATSAFAVESRDPAAQTAPGSATLGSATEEKRYAARAADSQEARNYQGGDVIVISASALAIVLLVLLIIVLL